LWCTDVSNSHGDPNSNASQERKKKKKEEIARHGKQVKEKKEEKGEICFLIEPPVCGLAYRLEEKKRTFTVPGSRGKGKGGKRNP